MRDVGRFVWRRILPWLVAVLSLWTAFGANRQPKEYKVTARVLRVYESPGMWSGVTEALQWIDVKVERSSFSPIKSGMNLRVGVPLVKGNGLFDQNSAGFSSDKIAEGKLIEMNFSRKCASERGGAASYVVEPNCIESLK